jgi:murein DD-endopeptidase MepM/ murein hydrolase activator NlpD
VLSRLDPIWAYLAPLHAKALALFTVLVMTACATPAPIVVYGPPGDPTNPPQGSFQPNAYLQLCKFGTISNAPPVDRDGWVLNFKPVIVVNSVVLASVPVNEVCLSSGFGYRSGRPHQGIDLTARPAGTIYAAAPGLILEANTSSSYGNQIVIDHGKGVYTRYAHLAFFDPSVAKGREIGFGQPLGLMGNTGNARGVHLHYEILTGNYRNPKASKGLTPQSPFVFPAYYFGGPTG